MSTKEEKLACTNILNRINFDAKVKAFKENQWGERHYQAWLHPRKGAEYMIKTLLVALADYADHFHLNEWAEGYERLADDGYAGPAWLRMVNEARQLLSMDLGRLDAGTLDTAIHAMLAHEGFSESDI